MSLKLNKVDTKRFAAEAVARLYSGNMTAEEEEALEQWLNANSVNRTEYQAVLDAWDNAGELISDLDIASALSQHHDTGVLFFQLRQWRIVATAAIIFLAIAVIFVQPWLLKVFTDPNLASYQTAVGEQRTVSLPDGSQVTLNTDTRLLVDFQHDKRRIVMDHGEAFFDIEKDPERPLTVVVGERSVTVLGTMFNIRWSGPNVTVAVIEGTVSVHSSNSKVPVIPLKLPEVEVQEKSSDKLDESKEVLLDKGSVGVFSDTTQTVVAQQKDDIQKFQSWRMGLVRFDDEPLYKVVSEINRYTKAKIVIEDKASLDMRVSGVFRLEDVNAVLAGLEAALPITVSTEFDRYVIVSTSFKKELSSHAE